MNFGEVRIVHVCFDVLKLVNIQEKIDGVVLGVVGDEVRDDLISDRNQVVKRFLVILSQVILFADVVGQIADVAVAPRSEISVRALQQIGKTLALALFRKYHGKC